MMKTRIFKTALLIIVIGIFSYSNLISQELTQTIRGKIIDQDSKTPMIGATIIILGTSPILGAATDLEGNFRIEKVPVGRVNLNISCLGYEDRSISNVLVGSGKEIVLNVEILESVLNLEAVTVTARKKGETRNKMSTVSAKTFSVEETNRYSGSLNDPARMVSSFAGVSGDAMGNNDIVVRGNSPRGILWRLEGVEIPNPNHFANEGSTGGPVNTLNASVLSNSDFFSGAFAPEYGNALSGVFDVYFRSGNNEKREYTFSAGIIGIDFTAEGPFKKGYGGSYLLNYRYSSIDLLCMTGLLDFGGIPKYQDASIKIDLPTKKLGKFSIFGLGGDSHINENDVDEFDESIIYSQGDFGANLGVVGVNHSYIINEKTFLKTSFSLSSSQNGYDGELLGNDNEMYDYFTDFYREGKMRVASTLSKKLNSKNKIQTGIIYTKMSYEMFGEEDISNTGSMTSFIDIDGSTNLMQAFGSWKYRLNQDLTLITGVHYTQFLLNNSNSIEPRVGLKWQFNSTQSLSAGFGKHSRLESISTYLATTDYESGNSSSMNKDLELTKANHYVIGYDNQLNDNLHLKVELYYQQLYNIPVENDVTSSFSMSNYSQGFTNTELVNEGTGKNYGVELTLERFFSNNFYYLFTGSLYEAKYTALDGIERDSRYNANYATNFIIGKEFKVGDRTKNKTIGFNSRITYLGANMYTPLDLPASIAAGNTVFDETQTLTMKGDDVFFLNIGFTLRRDRPKTTHELFFDIRNVTNNKAMILEYYNSRTEAKEEALQLPFIPNIAYIVKF